MTAQTDSVEKLGRTQPPPMMRRLVKWLGNILIRRVTRRPPDVIIGGAENPYMLRWWIIPRNRYFNLYLHQFRRSDDDRALHDHPWWNVSIVLDGPGYIEVMPASEDEAEIMRLAGVRGRQISKHRMPGDIVARKATALHRIKLIDGHDCKPVPVWSLFITGRVVRKWGFQCPQGWRPSDVFVQNTTDENGQITSKVGRGCD